MNCENCLKESVSTKSFPWMYYYDEGKTISLIQNLEKEKKVSQKTNSLHCYLFQKNITEIIVSQSETTSMTWIQCTRCGTKFNPNKTLKELASHDEFCKIRVPFYYKICRLCGNVSKTFIFIF